VVAVVEVGFVVVLVVEPVGFVVVEVDVEALAFVAAATTRRTTPPPTM
jgi:hypothetical protein